MGSNLLGNPALSTRHVPSTSPSSELDPQSLESIDAANGLRPYCEPNRLSEQQRLSWRLTQLKFAQVSPIRAPPDSTAPEFWMRTFSDAISRKVTLRPFLTAPLSSAHLNYSRAAGSGRSTARAQHPHLSIANRKGTSRNGDIAPVGIANPRALWDRERLPPGLPSCRAKRPHLPGSAAL
jgi:hypothetical protein